MSKPAYGGQAVMEGVMMRGKKDMAVAVRKPDGEIVVHSEELTSVIYTSRIAKLPFVRGLVMLWDSLVLGSRIMMMSASIAVGEEESTETESQGTSAVLWGSVLLGIALAVGLFFILPVLLVGVVDQYLASSFWSNVVEKAFRLALILGYMAIVGMVPDVKRVFRYHGAEHKTINAYEDGAPLEPEVVSRYSTAHPRCGTSFLMIVMIVSLIAFLLLGTPPMAWRILSRVLLIPVVAGISYELIKFGGAHYGNPIVKILLAPGMAVQKLTTKEPDLTMLEVAIAALNKILVLEGQIKEEKVEVASRVTVIPMSEYAQRRGADA